MIDAGGQRGTFAVGPRGVVMPTPNAGQLMDFESAVLRGVGGGGHPGGLGAPGLGGLAGGNSWSDDGQPPTAAQISQLAGAQTGHAPRFDQFSMPTAALVGCWGCGPPGRSVRSFWLWCWSCVPRSLCAHVLKYANAVVWHGGENQSPSKHRRLRSERMLLAVSSSDG